jgi:PKHD-type hydroxylase
MIDIKLLNEEPFVSGSMAWSFYNDDTELFASSIELFSKAQCESIIKLGTKSLGHAEIGTGTIDKKTRDSKTAWISPANGNEWIFQRLTNAILAINQHYFKFDLWGMAEGLQFTEYTEPSGMYKPHVDCMYKGVIRKLSLSVQLSDPNDYEGGDFVINNGIERILPKEQGTLIAFPSYVLHGVKPVTKGTRYSLVAWMTGPQFK